MDKKDIYEHLAKIYLDASSKKKKKNKAYRSIVSRNAIIVSSVIAASAAIILFSVFHKTNPYKHEVALLLQNDAVKINFIFNPAKKEIFTLNLNNLDVRKYDLLGFSVKKANYGDYISLRVELNSTFKERSEIYIMNIPHKWQDYKIKLSDFKNMSGWSEMSSLTFSVEEWNAREKKGVVYIDNVRLIK